MALSTSTDSLAVGASRAFNLSPGSALTLVAPPNCRVTVTETPNTVSASGVGGNASRVHNLQLGQTVTYGPYPMGGTVVVANASNSGGAVTWVRSDALVAESASGAVSLVSGDGTPFQTVPEKRGGSRLLSGKPWLRQPTTTTGLTAIGSVTLTATTRNGRNCIEITSPANTSVQGFYFALSGSPTIKAQQHVVFEVEDASEWNGGNWRLGFFDGAAGVFTGNGKQQVMTVGTQNGWDGVHVLAPLATEWSTVGSGAFDSTAMTQCAFRCVRKSGPTGTTRIWVYEIAEGEKNSLPSIIIGADDGAKTWYTGGLPVCEKYGFSSYLAFIADDRGTSTRMSQAEWYDAIVTRGHHAVVHGCKTGRASLRDYFSDYTGYSSPQAAMQADIAYNRDTMVSEGLDPDGRGRKVYVYPGGFIQPTGGAGDDTIINAITSEGMTVARRAVAEGALMANGGWSGAAAYLPIIGHSWNAVDEAANVAAIITQMQTEIAAGRSVILMFHQVEAVPDAAEEITSANLESILSAAATLVRAGSARAGKLIDFAGEVLTYTSPVHVGQ